MFSIEEKINGTQIKFQLYPNTTISWIKGAPPADAPECGFENEKCVEEATPKLSKLNRPSEASNQKEHCRHFVAHFKKSSQKIKVD